MYIKYHNLAQKSILVFGSIFFLFWGTSVFAKVPNDVDYSKQQAMWEIIKAPQAWEYSTGSKDVVVAIIDIGVDIYNTDLKENIWTNLFEIPGNNKDDDKNGFVDDVNGWNFVDKNNIVRPSVLDRGLDKNIISHGTIAAGLIGASGNNKESGTGVNWNVKIMPLTAVSHSGIGSYSDVVQAINYAVDNGADVINLSFTSDDYDQNLKQAIYNAYEKGVVVVAAGGNEWHDLGTSPTYPACLDLDSDINWVLGVGAMTNDKYLTNFSNYGKCIDLYAPGQEIFSTERYAPTYGYENKFGGPWQGTSFSAPIVAGTAGLIKSIQPNWTAKQITEAILARTDLKNGEREKAQGIALNMEDAVANAYLSLKVSPVIDYKYTLKDNIVYKSKGASTIYVTKIVNGNIVDIASKNIIGGYESEVFVLYKIKDYFFVKIISEKGKVLINFTLHDLPVGFTPSHIELKTNQKLKDYISLFNNTQELKYSFAGERL